MKGKRLLRKVLSTTLAVTLAASAGLGTASASWINEGEVPESIYDYPYWDTSLTPEERAADLISRLSLDEKVYLLFSRPADSGQINAVPRLGIGSYIWPTAGLHGVANMQGMLANFGKVHSENGEPWQDGTATCFPSTLGQGSTWNPELVAQMAQEIGYELRAYYNTSTKGLTAGGPGFNLSRDPRWGRADESFGEDVALASLMGEVFVDGYQGVYDEGDDVLAVPVVKHFAANNSENGRYFTSANMTEAEVREYYMRTFEHVVKEADPQGIMIAYNAINGVPNHGNYELLTEILRENWGFTGYVSSDNGGVKNLQSRYGTEGSNASKDDPELYPVLDDVTTEADAAAKFILAGGAHDLGAGIKPVPKYTKQNVLENNLGLTEDDVDKALMQLLSVRFRTGEFDLNDTQYDEITSVRKLMEQESVQELNLNLAEQSVVVLENDNNILPLAKEDESGARLCDYDDVVVVGKYVDEVQVTGYTSGQPEWKNEEIRVTFWDGLQSVYKSLNPDGNITLITPEGDAKGDWSIPSGDWNAIEAADLVIYIAYDNKNDGGEFTDFTDYQLGHGQYDLGNQILERAKNADVVFDLMTAAARELTPWLDESGNFKGDALVWQTFLGDKQGQALANVLFGITPASGRLTTSWYADEDQLGDLQTDYALYPDEGENYNGRTYMYYTGDIRYPFGYGLTYSTFTYGDLTLDKSSVTGDDTVTATLAVTNTSEQDGWDVVQIYVVSPNAAQTNRPNKQLVGFQKVWVPAGETVTAEVKFDVSDLSFWNEEKGCFACDLGQYTVYAGTDCDSKIDETNFELTKDMTPELYHAYLTADAYVANEIGETIDSRISASLNNDTYYQNRNEMPEGMTVTYTSTDESVAKVDQNGTITAVGAGVCSVEATVSYEGKQVVASTPVCVQLDKNPWLNVDQEDWYYDYAVYLWESGTVNIPHEVGGEYPNQDEAAIYHTEDSYFNLSENLRANENGTYTYPGADFTYDTADDEIIGKDDPRYQDIVDSQEPEEPVEGKYVLSNSALTHEGLGYTTTISIEAEENAAALKEPVLVLVGTTGDDDIVAWTAEPASLDGEATTVSLGSGLQKVTVYLLDGMVDFSDLEFSGCKSNVLTFSVQ